MSITGGHLYSGRFLIAMFYLRFAIFSLLLFAIPSSAQPLAPDRKLSISQALDNLPEDTVEAKHVVLIVPSVCKPPQAQQVDLVASGVEPPGDNSGPFSGMIDPNSVAAPNSPEAVAAIYGQQIFRFGRVQAIAPMQVKVLNADPNLAALPGDQLISIHPLPYLLGTLDQAQWKLLTTTGLKPSDLNDDQQALLRAALPRPFHIVPAGLQDVRLPANFFERPDWNSREFEAMINAYQRHIEIVGDAELQQVSLRAFLNVDFTLDAPGRGTVGFDPQNNDFTAGGAYKLAADSTFPDLSTNSTKQHLTDILCPTVLNSLKPGDLDWDSSALRAAVSVDGIKTIGELVDQAAKATGLELYSDPRFANRDIKFVGDRATPQAAADLLQALTLCISGAWRKVGPAYVLTNDVEGYGAQRQHIEEIATAWSNRLAKADHDVGGHLKDLDWGNTLSFPPAYAGALSSKQRAATLKDAENHNAHLRWSDLPSSAQASIRKQLQDTIQNPETAVTYPAVLAGLKPDTSVGVDYNVQFGLQLPRTGIMLLGNKYRVQSRHAMDTSNPVLPTVDQKVVLTEPSRGVLCAVASPEEARMAVDKLADAGLNTLYLDVFHNGCAYFPNTVLKPDSDADSQVLGAAIAEGENRHVGVVAVVDMFRWRADMDREHPHAMPVGYQEDVTVTGETPSSAIQRRLASDEIGVDRVMMVGPMKKSGWASPMEPSVRRMLPALLSALASAHGIAGIALQDTAPPGIVADDSARQFGISVGYSLRNRLAILRQSHYDPIDTGDASATLWMPEQGFQSTFPLDLPTFSNMGIAEDLHTMLVESDSMILTECFQAIKAVNPALPLMMRERKIGFTFDPWVSPVPNELRSTAVMDNPLSGLNSASALTVPAMYSSLKNAGILRFLVGLERSDIGKGRQGGLLIDLVMDSDYDNLSDALDVVCKSVSGPEPAAATAKSVPH